jgi:flavin reductase (DIM6/NTAB) family NADH-FMN oxidoreductase RutF
MPGGICDTMQHSAAAFHRLHLEGEKTGDAVPKFDRCRWHRGLTGVPILDDCAAWIEGSILSRFSAR